MREASRDAPAEPRERERAEHAAAGQNLQVHVVAVHAPIEIRQSGEAAVDQSIVVGPDAKDWVRGDDTASGAPERPSTGPDRAARERHRPDRCEPRGGWAAHLDT